MNRSARVTSSWEFLLVKVSMVATSATYTRIVAEFAILIETINMIDIGIIWSAISVIFVVSMVTIVTPSSCCLRCVCFHLFLLCFLYNSFLIFLLRGAFCRVLAIVIRILFREAAVLAYSLQVARFDQAWNGRDVAATTRGSCWLAAIEDPACSDWRQRAVAGFFNS